MLIKTIAAHSNQCAAVVLINNKVNMMNVIMKDVRVKSEQIKPMASYTEEHQPSVINEFIGLIIEVLVMLVMFFVMLSF